MNSETAIATLRNRGSALTAAEVAEIVAQFEMLSSQCSALQRWKDRAKVRFRRNQDKLDAAAKKRRVNAQERDERDELIDLLYQRLDGQPQQIGWVWRDKGQQWVFSHERQNASSKPVYVWWNFSR